MNNDGLQIVASYPQLCRAAWYGELSAAAGAIKSPAAERRLVEQIRHLPCSVFQSLLAAWNIGYDFQSARGFSRAGDINCGSAPFTN